MCSLSSVASPLEALGLRAVMLCIHASFMIELRYTKDWERTKEEASVLEAQELQA